MMRNRMVWILCMVATGILVSFRGGRISYALFYFTLLLPLSSLFYVCYVYLRFRIYQTIDTKTTVKGDWIPYVFTLSNEDVLTYTNLKVTFFEGKSSVKHVEFSKDYCLLPGQSTNQTTLLCCHLRGEYEVGVESVIITDYLKLFSIRYSSPSHIRMRVYPKVIPLRRPVFSLPNEDEKRSSNALRTADGLPDSEAREYEPGDALKTLHWKATARQNRLMTRKITPLKQSEVLFFMDLSKPGNEPLTRLKIEDKLIESALAVVHYFYQTQTSVKLIMDSEMNEMVVANKPSFETFYDFCKDVDFKSAVSIGRVLSHYLPLIPSDRRILCITHKMDKTFIHACHKAISNGIDVMVVYIGSHFDSATHPLDRRILWISIHWDQEISEVLEN